MQQGLCLENISKRFAETQALDGISFSVAPGEIVALLGPSGCGKSTTLSMIAGLEKPDSGEVFWDGNSLAHLPSHQRGFGLMFQDLALFPHLNVYDNIAFGLRMSGMQRAEMDKRIQELLALVGLPGFHKRDVGTLSGGEQQRVALARSLAPSPRLLMLDEPLGALDRALRERLLADLGVILRQMNQTALYVTHDQEEAFGLADRVVLINAGRVEQVGQPQSIYRQPASTFVARFLGLNNLMEGRLTWQDGQAALWLPIVPEIPISQFHALGDFTSLQTAQHSQGVTVLLRPDEVVLSDQAPCLLSGRVVRRSFRGDICRATVDIQGLEMEFTFLSGACVPAEGEMVQLGFDPKMALQVFPR